MDSRLRGNDENSGAEGWRQATTTTTMTEPKTVNAKVAKLQEQYGKDDGKLFITGMDYAIKDGLRLATNAGITMSQAPADLEGVKLAKALVKTGTAPDGTFWSGHLFDVAISHQLHNAVMADIEVDVSHYADKTTHEILNQAMYDVAQALGMKQAKLASFHCSIVGTLHLTRNKIRKSLNIRTTAKTASSFPRRRESMGLV